MRWRAACAQLKRDLVVITNSMGIAAVAGGNPTFRVILCPGTYDNREGSVLGEDTVEFISRYNADAAIIGASGITVDGPSDAISGAAAVKRAMIGRSLSTILVATHDKFGRANLERVCRLTQISDIVTDRQVSSEFRARRGSRQALNCTYSRNANRQLSQRLLAARRRYDPDDDQAGEQQPHAGADAECVEHGEQQHEEKRRAPDAGNIGLAAGDRGAADDHHGDRRQQILVADIDIGAAEIAGEQRAVRGRRAVPESV